jgi:TPR repeat protein
MMGIRVRMRAITTIVCLCALAATLAWGQNNPAVQALLAEAEKGVAAAQFKLGMAFLNGKEVPRDLEMAAHWLRKAADQNNAAAQFNLAVLYTQGAGVPRDYAEAAKLFQRGSNAARTKMIPPPNTTLASCTPMGPVSRRT